MEERNTTATFSTDLETAVPAQWDLDDLIFRGEFWFASDR